MRRGQVWRIPTVGRERTVLVVGADEVTALYGQALCVVVHEPGTFPESLVTVPLTEPVEGVVGVPDVAGFRQARFDHGKLLGRVDVDTMERVEIALRAILEL
ncbi:MAG: hypothetical protein HOU01_06155 [Streptomycetaceae bacterium]|uniref:mRNA interferase MazF n=1 Tax=Yinghuangia aomiensis TaxID=676205 RepID=A0ABP9HIA5_9ACTN|nr:hypothetical protein [Streptomycetaceae bacterium]